LKRTVLHIYCSFSAITSQVVADSVRQSEFVSAAYTLHFPVVGLQCTFVTSPITVHSTHNSAL